jgi:hypothetical protein
MFSRSTFAALAGSAVCVLAFAGPQTPTPSACCGGTGHGAWDLPHDSQPGYVDGFLNPTWPTPVGLPYHFSASLVDVPSPCLSCIGGEIHGYLDDGIGGPGPDFVVTGQYHGGWFSGSGSFTARLRRPLGTTTVGWISGSFDDPPASSSPGTFDCTWRLCN